MNPNTTKNIATAPTLSRGGAASKIRMPKPKKKALEYIAVEMEKKSLLFETRYDPALFSISMRLCIYCGTACNGGKIQDAKEILSSNDEARIAATFAIDAEEAKRVLIDEPLFWHWKDKTLIIDLYPLVYEKRTLAMRQRQAENRAKGWKHSRKATNSKQKKAPVANTNTNTDLPPDMLAEFITNNTPNKND